MPACATAPPSAEIRLMTHFASAEEPGDPATRAPDRALRRTPPAASASPARFCNSAGVLAWPEAHAEWIRPGVMLYGISPLPGRTGPDEGLRPVMTLSTGLIAVREVHAGEAVGYGGAWRAARPPGSASPPWATPTATRATPPPARRSWSTAGPPSPSAASPWTCWRSTSAPSPRPRSATPSPSGAGACPPSGSPPRRHHRLRAALRPRRPRARRAARRP